MNPRQPVEIMVKAGGLAQAKTASVSDAIAEFTIDSAVGEVDVNLKQWGMLRWITAIPVVD